MALHKLKDFHTPGSLDEALDLLGKNSEALVLAGGTFLHGLEARGLMSDVEVLVDIRKTASTVDVKDTALEIGATTTLARLLEIPQVADAPWAAALPDALSYPPVQIRNTATIGGCIAAACPFFDVPTALIALDAVAIVRGAGGERKLSLPDLFGGLFANTLEPGELITKVCIPRVRGKAGSAFLKLETNANDLAIVNAAARVVVDDSGTCTEVRVALGGGVAEFALRSPSAEKILLGSKLDAATLHAAGEAIVADIAPMSDHRASAEYRSVVAQVIVRRALERAVARLA
ncbi:MAG: FAD binding domain-containing protein [Rhizobiales bacterium]|nr:FAD binding domain-containing protein [Hyphomicrobiales bacterium]